VLILGIDPGSLHAGFGVVEQHGSSLRLVEHGRISCPRSAPLAERLARLVGELERVLDRLAPDAAAVESAFHGRNTRSLLVLAQARGALLATLAQRGLATREFSPAEVKSAVTGNGRAAKSQVERMVRILLALPSEPLAADAADALAIAICAAQRGRFAAAVARSLR
jgi:crossover junction endodeoxyribonuclease RuvC